MPIHRAQTLRSLYKIEIYVSSLSYRQRDRYHLRLIADRHTTM